MKIGSVAAVALVPSLQALFDKYVSQICGLLCASFPVESLADAQANTSALDAMAGQLVPVLSNNVVAFFSDLGLPKESVELLAAHLHCEIHAVAANCIRFAVASRIGVAKPLPPAVFLAFPPKLKAISKRR